MTAEDYRQASREIWDAMGAGWHSRRDWMWNGTRAVGEWMVEELDPRAGQTVLELACGVGDTTAAPPDPAAPGIFAMGQPERARELPEGAGFEVQRLELWRSTTASRRPTSTGRSWASWPARWPC